MHGEVAALLTVLLVGAVCVWFGSFSFRISSFFLLGCHCDVVMVDGFENAVILSQVSVHPLSSPSLLRLGLRSSPDHFLLLSMVVRSRNSI